MSRTIARRAFGSAASSRSAALSAAFPSWRQALSGESPKKTGPAPKDWDRVVDKAIDYLQGVSKFADREKFPMPCLVLLDLKLPKIDGLEVLKRIKADMRTKNIPVVILTSSKEQKDVVESYRLGVNSYIVKPVNFEQFVAAVQELGMYWLLFNQPPQVEA